MPNPIIRTLTDADRPAMEAFLLPRIQTSMFLICNSRLAGITDHNQKYGGHFAAAFEESENGKQTIVAVASHFWNGNINMQAPQHLEPLVHYLADHAVGIGAEGRPVKGVIGPIDQVQQTIDTLKFEINETNLQFDESEHLYELDLHDMKMPAALADGRVVGRRIEANDVDTATQWLFDYRVEAVFEFPTDAVRERCLNDTKDAVEKGTRWVLEDAATGKLLSVTGFNAVTTEAVQVGGVWTPHEHRGKGYARAAVAASLRDHHAEGVPKAILFTGIGNVPAQRAYEAIGFRHIGGYRIMMLR